jgi:hypothetical protein
MKRLFVIIPFVILGVLAVVGWRSTLAEERLSDEVRIRELLARGQQAITDKDVGEAMSCISRNYRDNMGLTYEAIRLQARQAIREGDYDVTLDAPRISINGASATAETHVEASTHGSGKDSQPMSFDLELELAKEPAKQWLVFPVTRWRITSMDGLPLGHMGDVGPP